MEKLLHHRQWEVLWILFWNAVTSHCLKLIISTESALHMMFQLDLTHCQYTSCTLAVVYITAYEHWYAGTFIWTKTAWFKPNMNVINVFLLLPNKDSCLCLHSLSLTPRCFELWLNLATFNLSPYRMLSLHAERRAAHLGCCNTSVSTADVWINTIFVQFTALVESH